MMTISPKFQFSQSSLQDYVDCARRFELRYLQQLVWPAVESEPVAEHERHMRQGSDFHHMVQQHLLGVPADAISVQVMDIDLHGWWHNYLNSHFVDQLPAQRHPEIQLSAPLGGYRMTAKYDLAAIEPGEKVVIVDWKTSRRKPQRSRIEKMLQTIVYPWLMVEAGAYLNDGQPITPEQVEMVYWFTIEPDAPERFVYGTAQHEQNRIYLQDLIREIETRTVFNLTQDLKQCRFCTYRSLCERGIQAGDLDEIEADFEPDIAFDFNFDQIAEVEF